jgi:hypothetical protein
MWLHSNNPVAQSDTLLWVRVDLADDEDEGVMDLTMLHRGLMSEESLTFCGMFQLFPWCAELNGSI